MVKIKVFLLILSLSFLTVSCVLKRPRRSIDLSAAHSLVTDSRLPGEIVPNNYTIEIRPIIQESTFTGKIKIIMTFHEPTNRIVLHASHDLEVAENQIKLQQIGVDATIDQEIKPDLPKDIPIRRVGRMIKKPQLEIFLKDAAKQGTIASLEIDFNGQVWESVDGMFKGGYLENGGERKNYLATHMRPNNARRLFPCFDEPAFKVPMTVSIARPKNFMTLFNMPLKSSADLDENYVIDTFESTPPMSTFTFGFVISQLSVVNRTDFPDPNVKNLCIKVYARPEIHKDLQESRLYERIEKSLLAVQSYFGVNFPLEKLDIVALPSFSGFSKPVDSWGLIMYKESELTQRSYYLIAQELIYQWLGNWATPYWWSDSHINKAIAGFVATQTALDLDNGAEFDGKWPMTILYSIYYEFSKRYPHSRITGMKQETICSKTELVLRMLNYSLGAETFKKGLQNFIVDREYKTFFVEDVWNALSKQAHVDNKLESSITINDIATSWIQKDRLPTLTIKRDYAKNTAKISQKVYLRERPHDIEGKDKMLWWIPIIMTSEDNLDFKNSTPITWLKNVRETEQSLTVAKDKFIIVNFEEIGPFPVNYDEENWNRLANYLQTSKGRETIPVYTRAKLLHDSWNLAYAGKLSFATALNMTLFMKSERNHLVWNPIFTLIDHIGRHIDASEVHKKFETYVATLLTPLYEELASDVKENEENYKRNLRSLSKTFLCRAGYKPCVEEAQTEFKKWMDLDNPEEGNPVANQFICPVFKHASMTEFEFGLQRVINFPADRMQSERTYLLKTLAGCPNQPEKINRLLNITILEENANFSENDVFLIFSMLSGGSAGYKTLFHFLKDNWDIIKIKFMNKTNLWDSMVSVSTANWNVQAGYDLVSQLYRDHQGDFASAEHIIEKSLKNIKEEAKWSEENLPVIEKWLNNFLSHTENDNKFVN